jgi:hypothetical protein
VTQGQDPLAEFLLHIEQARATSGGDRIEPAS